jgi:hypothetical protein
MKPHRDASELAARLSTAAGKPPALPAAPSKEEVPVANTITPAPPAIRPAATTPKGRPTTDTIGISLRPARTLLQRYTIAAAERTRETGRVVSAQEIMLEQLEHGPS